MTPAQVDVVPKGWSQQQCSMCEMIFALPAQPSGVNVRDVLREELDRHVHQNHIDLPGRWNAEDHS
jgi:hypothetical protein